MRNITFQNRFDCVLRPWQPDKRIFCTRSSIGIESTLCLNKKRKKIYMQKCKIFSLHFIFLYEFEEEKNEIFAFEGLLIVE